MTLTGFEIENTVKWITHLPSFRINNVSNLIPSTKLCSHLVGLVSLSYYLNAIFYHETKSNFLFLYRLKSK